MMFRLKRLFFPFFLVAVAGCPAPVTVVCGNDSGLVVTEECTITFDDADGDGFGDAATARCVAEAPSGAVENGDDCDDNDGATFPDAEELCDGLDNDCDGVADDGVLSTFYADTDGDGHGGERYTAEACAAPDGYVGVGDDCDDEDENVHPGAAELCDGVQNDCDAGAWTLADEDGTASFTGADGSTTDLSGMAGAQRIDAAGTVQLCPGTWTVNLTVAADGVSIVGSGAEASILSGGDAGSVLFAEGVSDLAVQGVAMTDGAGTTCNKTETCGGAVYLVDSVAAFDGVWITDSTSVGLGGGALFSESTVTMTDSTVSGNHSDTSGGGIGSYISELLVTGSDVLGNTSVFNGGGVLAINGELIVADSTIDGNGSASGGGVNTFSFTTVSIVDTVVSNNSASFYGGGLFVGDHNAVLNTVSVSGNTASLGGGLYIGTDASVVGTAASFSSNKPGDIYDAATKVSYSPDAAGVF